MVIKAFLLNILMQKSSSYTRLLAKKCTKISFYGEGKSVLIIKSRLEGDQKL